MGRLPIGQQIGIAFYEAGPMFHVKHLVLRGNSSGPKRLGNFGTSQRASGPSHAPAPRVRAAERHAFDTGPPGPRGELGGCCSSFWRTSCWRASGQRRHSPRLAGRAYGHRRAVEGHEHQASLAVQIAGILSIYLQLLGDFRAHSRQLRPDTEEGGKIDLRQAQQVQRRTPAGPVLADREARMLGGFIGGEVARPVIVSREQPAPSILPAKASARSEPDNSQPLSPQEGVRRWSGHCRP